MDFKYKTRLNKTWDTSGLGRVLKMYYPGATTISEAISMAKSQKETKIDPEPSSDEPTTTQVMSKQNPSELQVKPKARLPYADTDEEF